MIVEQLIAALQQFPKEAEVLYLFDGALRGECARLYATKSGHVAIASSHEEVVYLDEDRPIDAPASREDCFWRLPSMGGDDRE